MRPAHALALVLAMCVSDAADAARKRRPTFALASETTRPIVCTDNKTREKIRAVLFQALDLALNDHAMHLYEVWMKDPSGQPARARTGIDKGIEAYIHAQRGIAQWDVMTCERD